MHGRGDRRSQYRVNGGDTQVVRIKNRLIVFQGKLPRYEIYTSPESIQAVVEGQGKGIQNRIQRDRDRKGKDQGINQNEQQIRRIDLLCSDSFDFSRLGLWLKLNIIHSSFSPFLKQSLFAGCFRCPIGKEN